jgi:hypothetical protein
VLPIVARPRASAAIAPPWEDPGERLLRADDPRAGRGGSAVASFLTAFGVLAVTITVICVVAGRVLAAHPR